MLDNEKVITVDEIVPEATKCYEAGLRLMGLTAVELPDKENIELFYHFDRDLTLSHLRTVFPKSAKVPSISGVYFCALLGENEIKDQYGVDFQNIVIDFGGALYLEQEVVKSPFCSYTYATKKPAKGGK